MQAIIIDEPGAAPTVREVPTPVPAPGEVLVSVRASSVNPMDGAVVSGMLAAMVEHVYPITLGRDFAGTVEATGEGVTSVDVGDEVFGIVPAMRPDIHAGAWAEHIAVAQTSLVKRPANVDLQAAGVAGLAAATAVVAVDALAPQSDEVVLVVGATGGVGTVAVQLIAAAGATVLAPSLPEDEAYLRRLGVTKLMPRDGDVVATARQRYPDGVDAVLDLVSYAPGGYDAALVDGGRLASTLNAAGEGPGRINVHIDLSTEVLERIAALLGSGALTLPIAATYDLTDAPHALLALATGHTQGKIALRHS